METLKKREIAILDYMKSEIKHKGYPPTIREICEALKIKSTSTAHKDIENLERKGYIIKDPSKPRALMVVDPNDPTSPSPSVQYEGNLRSQVIDIPIVGRIAAGVPILAEENIEDYFPIPASFGGKGTSFMLTVTGDSMIDAGIFDGD